MDVAAIFAIVQQGQTNLLNWIARLVSLEQWPGYIQPHLRRDFPPAARPLEPAKGDVVKRPGLIGRYLERELEQPPLALPDEPVSHGNGRIAPPQDHLLQPGAAFVDALD